MNQILVDIMFRLSGLPASAMVGHARLLEDLGFENKDMVALMYKIHGTIGVHIPEQVWNTLERVGDIQDYLTHANNIDNISFSEQPRELECI